MTTYQGVAVATQSLRLLAWDALRLTVPGARVTLERPEETSVGSREEPRLNIYLFQVTIDPTMRNSDLPMRANGQFASVPTVPVRLRYLFSFFGPTPAAHLMLGTIETAMHAAGGLDAPLIARAEETHRTLQGSGLEQQQPQVRIVPGTVSLEELSRFWSGFFQTPYTLSTVFDLSPVMLSADVTPSEALPVHAPNPRVTGSLPPRLDPLPAVTYEPGRAVHVSGHGLALGQYVGLGTHWRPLEQAGGGFAFTLPDHVKAGIGEARLGHPHAGAIGPIPGSDPTRFELRPAVESVRFDEQQRTVTVDVRPPVQPAQQVTLALHATTATTADPASATLTTTPKYPTSTLVFDAGTVGAGEYLAILTVDKAASSPVFRHGRYEGPTVVLA
jgi:hypothetical protein